jgi:hypothetical protein
MYRVKPYRQRARLIAAGQMAQGAIKHFLHAVLGIFAVPTHLHAERINGVLQKLDSPFDGSWRIAAQQVDSLGEFWTHASPILLPSVLRTSQARLVRIPSPARTVASLYVRD